MARRSLSIALIAAFAACGVRGRCAAEIISATQVEAKTIRVVVKGKFETDFTLRKGFGSTWFDLKHDPEKKHNLAPVAQENGFFWIKAAAEGQRGASWYANPSKEMELLESGPVRVRVRFKGVHMRYGKVGKKSEWPELGFELTWTVYPTGHIFGDYTLSTEKPLLLHHYLAILKSTGHWGQRGTGVGKGEIHPASELGDGVKPTGRKRASWVLQHSNGPTHFTDILMVFQKGKYPGTYWNEGYKDRDYRTGLNILGRFKDKTVPQGKDHIPVMFRIAQDMNTVGAAALHANDYRNPDKLKVVKGGLVADDEGDRDADGYNEQEGCYVLQADADGVIFKLRGKETPRMNPAFKVKGWDAAAPRTMTLNNRPVTINACVRKGVLLLQILERVTEDVTFAIGK